MVRRTLSISDTRAASIPVGFLLIVAVITMVLFIFHVGVSPGMNKKAEAQSFSELRSDMHDFDAAISRVASTGVSRTVTLRTKVSYPLQFTPPSQPDSKFTTGTPYIALIDNAKGSGDWTGTMKAYKTRPISVYPEYNRFQSAGILQYEHGIVHIAPADAPNETTVVTDSQPVVSGDDVTIVRVNGSVSVSRRGDISIDMRLDNRSQSTITNTSKGPVKLTLETSISEAQWRDMLSSELADNGGHVTNISYNQSARPNTVTITLEKNVSYNLNVYTVHLSSRYASGPEDDSSSTGTGSTTVSSSNTIGVEWVRIYDGGYTDIGESITVNSGNVYVTGRYNNTSSTYKDIRTVMYDSQSGDKQWEDSYHTAKYDYGRDVIVDSSGNPIVVGKTLSNSNYDFTTRKLSPSGSHSWTSTHDEGGHEYPQAAANGSSGTVYAIGDVPGSGYDTDFGIVQYSSTGFVNWNTSYDNGGEYDYSTDAASKSGNVYITGYTGKNPANILTVKYDSSGSFQWAKTFNSSNEDRGAGVAVGPGGDVYVAGHTSSSTKNIRLIKYNASSGAVIWNTVHDNGTDESAEDVTVGPNGDVYVVGSISNTNSDYYIVRYNSDGTIQWNKTWDSGYSDVPSSIDVDSSGAVYVTGESKIDGDTKSYVTLKLSKDGTTWNSSTLVDRKRTSTIGHVGPAGSDFYAQSFTGDGNNITQFSVWMQEANTEGQVKVQIVPDNGNGYPNVSNPLYSSTLRHPDSVAESWFTFDANGIHLNDSQTYYVLIDGYKNSGATGSVRVGSNNSSTTSMMYSNDGGSSWSTTGDAMAIKVETDK